MNVTGLLRLQLVASFLMLLSACRGEGDARRETPSSSTAADTTTEITEDLRIGTASGTGPTSFSDVAALAVDRWGRIYVLDRAAQDIRLFDSSGAPIRVVGRRGSGPGEFAEAIGLDWDTRGHLWVVDQRNARYTVLDTSGTVVAERPRPIAGFFTYPWRGRVDSAGHIYEFYRRPGLGEEVLLRYDSTLRRSDTIPLPPYENAVFRIDRQSAHTLANIPFSSGLAWVCEPSGFVWFGVTDQYRLFKRTLNGDTVAVATHAVAPVPVSAAERDSAVAALEWFRRQGGRVDASKIPTRKPVFDGVFVDDGGNLWVRVAQARGKGGDVLDVFNARGEFLGRLSTTFHIARNGPFLVRGSRLYASTQDGDGVVYVVRATVPRLRQP